MYFCVVCVGYKESKTRSKVKRSEIKNQYRIINTQMKRNVQKISTTCVMCFYKTRIYSNNGHFDVVAIVIVVG